MRRVIFNRILIAVDCFIIILSLFVNDCHIIVSITIFRIYLNWFSIHFYRLIIKLHIVISICCIVIGVIKLGILFNTKLIICNCIFKISRLVLSYCQSVVKIMIFLIFLYSFFWPKYCTIKNFILKKCISQLITKNRLI